MQPVSKKSSGKGSNGTSARTRDAFFAMLLTTALTGPIAAQEPKKAPTIHVKKENASVVEVNLFAPPKPDLKAQPWLDPSHSADERADLALAQLTLDEKIQLLHGTGYSSNLPGYRGGVGFVPGIRRLGIPDLNMGDSTVGVANQGANSRYATLLPSAIAEAASWDLGVAYDYAALVGQELRAQGFNVSLAGGANLAREPRNGRTFEYRGEDPLLAGKMTAQAIRGMQAQNVIGDLKHFALNDQEVGRNSSNVDIDYRAARESDLLAFEIAVKEAQPGMVMCAYNKVWGAFSCENTELLSRILKQEWGFRGWVVSDWDATHSTEKAILAGLDQEQPSGRFFGDPLKKAVLNKTVPVAALDSSVRRILRTMFAIGVVDKPPVPMVVDIARGQEVARLVEEKGAVLLKNAGGLLPLASTVRTVAVIGGHADIGVLTGGGSGQVSPPGGNALKTASTSIRVVDGVPLPPDPTWWPSSPLRALQNAAPNTRFIFDDGTDPARAAKLAASTDMAIIFAYASATEGSDSPDLALPDDQDRLIDAVATANARSTVVLETGSAVTMPWVDKVGAVIAAWFPGAAGGEALANLIVGKVNFTGKLPITFPRSEADLPHPAPQGSEAPFVELPQTLVPGVKIKVRAPFDVRYPEGALVGYKWFQAKGKSPMFSFGHGLSYTTFEYSNLKVSPKGVAFSITNTGARAGAEIAQVYVALPAPARLAPRQLAGWARVQLNPGETREISVSYEALAISTFDIKRQAWTRPAGKYYVFVGGASDKIALTGSFKRR